MGSTLIDITGMRFGKLTVIGRAADYITKGGQNVRQWKCVCDCGKETVVRSQNLRNGHTRSCGCLVSEDLTGKRFGMLEVIGLHEVDSHGNKRYLCLCDCGNTDVVDASNLRRGLVHSCGCVQLKYIPKKVMHGYSGTRLYNVWNGMKQRCFNENSDAYPDYGGRGITICEEWLDFEKFRAWALSTGYDENAEYGKYTIEREDVNGNYEPENCKWITIGEQTKNKRVSNGYSVK